MRRPVVDQDQLADRERALSGLRRLEIELTQICNLQCDYCFVTRNLQQPTTRPMAEELLEAIAATVSTLSSPEGVEVVLTGGEPLSCWPSVVRAVEIFAGALGPRLVGASVLTNGTLLRPDRAAWLAENRVRVTVGLDGTQEVHDAHRRNSVGIGSWRRAFRGASSLVDEGIVPDVSMVVADGDCASLSQGIEWVCDVLGPGTLSVVPAAPPTLGGSVPRPGPEEWAELIVALHDRARTTGTRVAPVADVVDAMTDGVPMLHSDDGAWGGSMAVDVHGNAGPSLELLSAGVGAVALGSLDLASGPFQRWRDRSPARNAECRECSALGLCGNASMYASTAAGGSPAARDPWHCRMQRHLVNALEG